MRCRLGRSVPVGLALLLLCVARRGNAADDRDQAATDLDGVNRELQQSAQVTWRYEQPPTAAQRLAAAELMIRTGDHRRAIDELNLVLELQRQGAADQNIYVDALFLLGEACFADGQALTARRHFSALLEQAPAAPFMAYAGRSAARLVDIAASRQEVDELQKVQDRLQQLPIDASGSLEYARSKAYLARGEWMLARVAVSHIAATSKYHPQAQYLLGVIELASAQTPSPAATQLTVATAAKAQPAGSLPERYVKAVTQFQRVTQLKVEIPEHRQVVDTAWMALGRIFYETANYLDAADAYNHVRKGSPEYSAMLNELSWAYVRLGDYDNALPLLETLSLTEADTLQRVDGALLRGDVLLRSGKDDAALQAYQDVRVRHEPLRTEIAGYLSRHPEQGTYYDQLLLDPQGNPAADQLSSAVFGWVSEIAREQPALGVARDDADCRTLLAQSGELARKLSAALASTSRVRLFPKQRAELEHWESLHNRLASVRLSLAQSLDGVRGSGTSDALTLERRALMPVIARLPKTQEDFARRERDGQWQWGDLSRELQRVTLDTNRLQALTNGLLRLLEEKIAQGRGSDPTVAQLQREIAEQQAAITGYRQRIEETQRTIDLGRVQIGIGDQRFVNDRTNRDRFAQLLAAELAAQPTGPSSNEVVSQLRGLFERATLTEQQLALASSRLDAEIRSQARQLRSELLSEQRKLNDYQKTLQGIEQEARGLLGAAAKDTFVEVEERLTDLVRRSDIAVAAQAWEARERAQKRVIELQHARAVEEAEIKQELQEISGEASQ